MCYLCENNGGEYQGCQDCGRLICFDIKQGDDVIAPAYVTESGDLFCDSCGREYDSEANRDEWLAMWEDYPGELLESDQDELGPCSGLPDCTCERCIQNHPERVIDMGEDFDE